jgi:hypothetical protein
MPPSFARTVEGTSGRGRTVRVRGAALVLLLAVSAAVVLVLRDRGDDDAAPADLEPFLAAYERSRTEELVVTGTFLRTLNDGRQLEYERTVVQRPPDDHLVIGAGSASGRIGGRIVRCNVEAEGTPPTCTQGPEAPPYDDEVAREVDVLRELLAGAYSLTDAGDGCWDLLLEVAVLSPPYGGAARFCFDEDSGAQRYLEVRREEGIDVTEATEIRTEVTDADLRPGTLGEPIATG